MIDKLWLKYGKEIHRDDNKHYEIKSVSNLIRFSKVDSTNN